VITELDRLPVGKIFRLKNGSKSGCPIEIIYWFEIQVLFLPGIHY